jgi:hypothetical protein
MKRFVLAALALTSALTLAACSSAPKPPAEPEWTAAPARTVEGGYIIYVGSGEDRTPEKARFKAESMALQDLANECSFAPKGTRIEDHFDTQTGIITRSYAKVAVEFQDCEAAKAATTPEQIRNLGNVQLTEQIKRYQDLVDSPEPQETVVLADNGMPSSPPPNVVVVHDYPEFVVYRQQVAYINQSVILAPPAYYPPGAPITTQPVPAAAPFHGAVMRYEANNPQLRTSPMAFSNSRPNFMQHQASALREGRSGQNRMEMNRQQRQSQKRPPNRGQSKGRGRKKKRRE